ncbi:magnesium transporter CorA family protein [Mesobacillus harenae]|uniref:magnesium transporter CorA family protein n=1 Tax=Mesobacillus harenae TaxID=2213203 RepID=UPI0015809C77|nr:magnesium transporter CorA family protein [Mesobacillus harenae]
MKHSFNSWDWYQLDLNNLNTIEDIPGIDPSYKEWLEEVRDSNSNRLKVVTRERGEEFLWGSLIYQQDMEESEENHFFHFYVAKDYFITIEMDFDVIETADFTGMSEQMKYSKSAVEGFLVLMGEILTNYLINIDRFEKQLFDLMWEMKEKNGKSTLEKINQNRHEVLIWRNLFIPVMELKMGIEEAFGDEVLGYVEYKRTAKRLERGRNILKEYLYEIETMVHLEEVVSSYRGNEIMKTLTVITMLFTPVMAWGALWGMNFKVMPELEWKLGYAFAWLLIILSTLWLYVYLKTKGWIGDLLKGKKNGTFFD